MAERAMKSIYILTISMFILFHFQIHSQTAYAQINLSQPNQGTNSASTTTSESTWCTKVGNPTTVNPCSALTGQATATGSADHPKAPPIDPSGLRQAIIDQFGITMNGFGSVQLQWAWEKLWDMSKTNFNKLIHGKSPNVTAQAVAPSDSQQLNCGQVNVGVYQQEVLFKIVLTHELGHIIYWCNENELNRKREHAVAYADEGAVTGYGEPVNGKACTGTPAITEDYPEMITYYLNPGIPEQTVSCSNRKQIPYGNGRYPLHFNIATQVLGNY